MQEVLDRTAGQGAPGGQPRLYGTAAPPFAGGGFDFEESDERPAPELDEFSRRRYYRLTRSWPARVLAAECSRLEDSGSRHPRQAAYNPGGRLVTHPLNRSVALSLRLYRALARAFPDEFNNAYGDELAAGRRRRHRSPSPAASRRSSD